MAVLDPFCSYHQLPGKSTTLLRPRFINTHTFAGGTINSVQRYFSQPGNPYSHRGTSGSGEIRQWQDLQYRAASDLEGNPESISYENEDSGDYFPTWTGGNVPEFTPAQARAIEKSQAWDCIRFGIPPMLTPDSLPTRRGLSWHRQGIDPWRVEGGLRYSIHYGKLCPGNKRIEQYSFEMVPNIQRLVLGEELDDVGTIDADQYRQLMDDVRVVVAQEVALAVHHVTTGATNSRYDPARPMEGQGFSWVDSAAELTLPELREALVRASENSIRSGVHFLSTGQTNTMFNGKSGAVNLPFKLNYDWMRDATDLTDIRNLVEHPEP